MGLTGRIGVRLDSGDVDALSRGARKLLDEAGLAGARIFASGGLDELEVEKLVADGAPVDAFGIGTQMGVSADAPFVDSVYKLTDIDGRPVLKLSAGKATAPGRKQAWRGSDGDTLALRDEPGPADAEPLLELVMRDGVRTGSARSIEDMRERFDADLAALPAAARQLRDATPVSVRLSERLVDLTASTRAEALRKSGEAES
jgi:nicotinate phosphoribosyltransferase